MEVECVVLYASLARRGTGGDVDLLAGTRDAREWDSRQLLGLALTVSEALGVGLNLVDIVDSNSALALS